MNDTLANSWLERLKNRPIVAAVIVVAVVVGGIASFTDAVSKIGHFFSEKASPTPFPVTPRQPATLPPARVSFSEDFTLHEQGSFVSHGVAVRVGNIGILDGIHLSAHLAVSAAGPADHFGTVVQGDQIEIPRQDCDYLRLVVRDIQLIPANGMTLEQLKQMGPAAEALLTRNVLGTVTGKCAP